MSAPAITVAPPAGDSEAFDERLLALLDDHADEAGHEFEPEPLVLEARIDGAFAGGLSGRMLYGVLLVRYLAAAPGARHQGVGSTLIARAEDWARARGAHLAYLDTFGFQAAGFYRRLGYVEIARAAGDRPERDRIYLAKALTPPRAASGDQP
ncbi:MAG: GNAT family N-acetyltransferase [Pseudomonadota bacterium]